MNRTNLGMALLLAVAGSVGFGCANAADDIDQYTDCIDICGRYADCIDSSYDTDACADRCEEMDHRNGTTRVDTCENCLDDRSCTGSVFACTAECVGIVP